jgi:hypothetical protein
MNKAINDVRVTIPKPPSCINNRIKSCPSNVKTSDIFTVDNPVTHTAEVEVNKASIQETWEYVALGSIKSKLPKSITII